jgi:HD-GYP domain-containing protein (c-di-GMP phosphodiesterase class II)
MRRIPTELLKNGDQIARNIYTRPDIPPLLRVGSTVTDAFRETLLVAGITSVWIDDEASRGIEPLEPIEEETRQRGIDCLRETFKELSQPMSSGPSIAPETVEGLHDTVAAIVSDIERNTAVAIALNDLAAVDGYTMQHSLEVTAIGVALGSRTLRLRGWIDHKGTRRFDDIDHKLVVLGVGLMLHDIGKLEMPRAMLTKAGPLDSKVWEQMRMHPEIGYQILKGVSGVDPVSRAVVRWHHEQWDGSGYPDKRAGQRIHQFARIGAIADVFDALTAHRSYKQPLPPHAAYAHVLAKSGSHFDPEIVDVFREAVAPYPPGSGVMLSDGSRGVVKSIHQVAVARPVVRILTDSSGAGVGPTEVDLRTASDLAIVGTDLDPWR